MNPCVTHLHFWLGICLAVVALTTILMSSQSRYLFRMDSVKKSFSVFRFEFPASRSSICGLIGQVNQLLDSELEVVFKAIRRQLYIDFIFMPAAYIGILLLCMAASCQSGWWISILFFWLGWSQFLAWFCNVVENIYLLRQLREPFTASILSFMFYRVLEIIKWGLSCTGFLLAVIQLIYSNFHL